MAAPWDRVSYPRVLLAVLAVVLVSALYVGAASSATDFGVYNPAWDGSADLRSVANSQNTEAVIVQNTSQYASGNESNAVSFVLSPERRYDDAETERVERFVRNGGTLVVAEDFGTESNALLRAVGADARVDGRLLRDERYTDESPDFPVARNVNSHSYTEGVDALTLNRGTAVSPGGAEVIVNSSSYAYFDENQNGELDDAETLARHPVATAESVGTGDVVVVSDPSIFINTMLERDGNRVFAENLIRPHDRVLLDTSHASSLPPLVTLRLALQRTPLVQLLIGIGLVAAIAYNRRIAGLVERVRDRRRPTAPAGRPTDPEAIERWVRQRHPDWDPERVRRLTEEVISGQQKGEGNG